MARRGKVFARRARPGMLARMKMMQTMLPTFVAIVAVGLIGWSLAADPTSKKASKKTDEDKSEANDGAAEKELLHVVSLKFKESAAEEDVEAAVQAFAGLKGQIEEVKWIKWGTNNSPEKLDKGFTHCFILAFESEADRDAYLVHPAHTAFVDKWIKPVLDEPFVIDFWAEQP